jgi:imidazolonepropionase-like amidohydrolase
MRRFSHLLAGMLALIFAGSAIAGDLALTHARIYASPDVEAIADGSLVVRDGKILSIGAAAAVKIPAGAKIIDLQGSIVTAGYWNSHVHLMMPPMLKAATRSDAELSGVLQETLTRWGFTTVFDISSMLSNTNIIRQRIASGSVIGPKILTVGDPFFPKGGTPIYVKQFLHDNGFPDEEITDLPASVARVHRQIHDGADGVKLFAGAIVGGDIGVLPMPLDQARALVAAAHADGKPVFAHPTNLAGLTVSIDSGVDILAHTTPDGGPWTPDLTARIAAHHMALIPTLTLFEVELKRAGGTEETAHKVVDLALQQVDAYSKAGGQILFGTDVGYIDVFDTTEEYRQLGRVLNWRQILTTLTVAPAQRFGYAHKGRLAEGMDADLVVLQADPAKDVTAFAQVRMTLRQGQTIYNAGG